jgi:hypothetical protein
VHTPVHNDGFRAYLGWLLVTLIVSVAFVASFNLWVDSYRLFSAFPETERTSRKVRPESNIAAIKLLNGIAARPDAVILGNSRADIGFRPDHRGFWPYQRRVYNLAIPGAGIQRVRDDFRALLERHDVEFALLAVDFQDFVLNSAPVEPPSRTPAVVAEALLRKERLQALFTLTGLADSLKTLRAAHDPYAATLRADGLNPLLDYVPIAARDGYPALFGQRLSETAVNFVRARKGIYPEGANDSAEFAALRDILGLARQHGVRMVVTTYPYHAQYYLLFEELGLWGEFERWKLAVQATVRSANASAQPGPAVALWDFAAFSEPATTRLEDSDERGAGRWYWEAGHFKPSLGDRVLDEVFAPSGGQPPAIGFHATGGSFEAWLGSQRTALRRYAVERPEQLEAATHAVQQAQAATDRRERE